MDQEQLKKLKDEVVEKLLATENPELQREFVDSVYSSMKTHKANTIENTSARLNELKRDFDLFVGATDKAAN